MLRWQEGRRWGGLVGDEQRLQSISFALNCFAAVSGGID